MNLVDCCLALTAPLLLLSCGLLPSAWANRHVPFMKRLAGLASAGSLLLAVATVIRLAVAGRIDAAAVRLPAPLSLRLGVYVDSLTAVMLLLIGVIGAVIVRYAIRYLDREATQGRFLRWLLMTLGAVNLLVVSGNLVLLTASWMLTSYGLHKLLTHYSDRSWAVWAARKKFLISRLGDVLLLLALGLTWSHFGSVEYGPIFAAAEAMHQSSSEGSLWVSVISSLFVLGAMTKSAQFPFHSWLPDTMETPTPVSALMHAGIINAGGFLILRLSPLISLSHAALDFLALMGAFTALFGAVVMLTQTSIKRQLAWSTMAQMGFMMLQCGLGAFSAALLHIVAHSLYKAHAFLSSGSVLDLSAKMRTEEGHQQNAANRSLILLPPAFGLALTITAIPAQLMKPDAASTSGALVLSLVMTIALTQLLWSALSQQSARQALWGVVAALLISFTYSAAYRLTDRVLAQSVSHRVIELSVTDFAVITMLGAGFTGLFLLQAAVMSASGRPFMRRLYVHALNGFYFDIPARRITALVWGFRGAAP